MDPPASEEAAAPGPETASDPPAPAAPEPSGPAGPNTRFRFNCVDCDLLEFVRNIANELKLNYLVDPKVQGVVHILTYGEMRRGDLMSLLETVLEINGAAIVKTGPVYRILPSRNAKQLPLDIRRDPATTASPARDSRVLQIVPVNFVPAADMAELLNPFLSEGGDITYHRAANFLIVTDAPANIGKLLELVRVFDSAVFGGKRVRVYALENTRATNLALELEIIFAGYAGTEESPIRFLPISRLNSVLVISPNTGSFEEVDRWIARLDQAGQNREIRNYFVKIQNGDAASIAGLLLKIYGAGTREMEEEAFLPPQGNQTDMLQAAADTQSRTEEIVQGEIKIVADEQNNALIVQCGPQDFEVIEETIRELDRVPRQVLINVKIYEVVLDDELSMGISAFLQDRRKPVVTSPSATTAGYGTAAGGSGTLNLATRVLMGDTRELVAFLNAEETRNRSRVLSAPTIIASDNIAANIQVGSSIPTLTSQGVVPGGTGGGSLFSNTIRNRDTGVILNVTPRINAGGMGHPGRRAGSEQPRASAHRRHPVAQHQHPVGPNPGDHQERADHRHRRHHFRDQRRIQERASRPEPHPGIGPAVRKHHPEEVPHRAHRPHHPPRHRGHRTGLRPHRGAEIHPQGPQERVQPRRELIHEGVREETRRDKKIIHEGPRRTAKGHEGVGGGSRGIRQGSGRGKSGYPRRAKRKRQRQKLIHEGPRRTTKGH